MFLTVGGIAFAQNFGGNPNRQTQTINIPCDNTQDCAARVQYETDLAALLTAQANLNAARQVVQADIQNYQLPVQQAALTTQLTADQATLQKLGGAVTAKPVSASTATLN